MLWKIILVLGILGVLLGFSVIVICFALVAFNGGRTTMSEAMLGIIPGAIFLILSFFVALLGLIFVIKNRKKKA